MTRTARWLALAGAGLFLALCLAAVFAVAVEYDEAYNATVAKAVAAGLGYRTSYHVVIPYNPEITTGPTVLLPMAALIRIWGITPWAPGLATWLVTAPALLALALGLARRIEAAGGPPVAAGVALWPFLLGVWLFGAMGFFSVGMGEAPAIVLMLLALLPLADSLQDGRRRGAILGGLLLGLAVLTKLIILIPAVGILGTVALIAWRRHGLGRAVALPALAGALTLAPTLLFLLVRLGSVNAVGEMAFLNAAGGGFGVLGMAERWRALAARLAGNWHVLAHWSGGAVGLALIAAGGLAGVAWRGPGRPLRLALLAPALAGMAVHLAWWLPLGNSIVLRHGLPAIMLALFAVTVLPALAWGRWHLAALPTLAVLALLGATREARLGGLPPGYHSRSFLGEETVATTSRLHLAPVPRLAEQLEARDALIRIRAAEPDAALLAIAWWVPRELEYLLPEHGVFRDMTRLPALDGPALLVVSEAYWNWNRDAAQEALRARCTEALFRNRSYAILRCR